MAWKVEALSDLEKTAEAVVTIQERLDRLEADGWEIFQLITYADTQDVLVIARKIE